jgi:uncharacterized protein (DUF952 family)
MGVVYHITTKRELDAARSSGTYVNPSLRTDGFIHCSH